ncbi:MAG: hypothetical protein OXM55_00620 [Bdellovibrionales bacterium]|nr:hypothetical protein [Bdellovibrionales bacterium]
MIGKLNEQACKKTFSGKNIGQSIDRIQDGKGIPLLDLSTTKGLFNRHLKVVKIETRPKTDPCSSITAASSGDCPPGCTYSSPGPCSGTSSTSTPGYAEMDIYFSRPGSLFEAKKLDGVCTSLDQTDCYKNSCILSLEPTHTGANGVAIGDCAFFSCNKGISGGGGDVECYQVTDTGDTPEEVALVGCGTTQDVTQAETTAYGFNAGGSGAGLASTFIGFNTGKLSTGHFNTFLGYEAGKKNTTGNHNIFIGHKAGYSNIRGDHSIFLGHEAGYNTIGNSGEFSYNIFLGTLTGNANTTGTDNTYVGHKAGRNKVTGNRNTFIGSETGYGHLTRVLNTGSYNTFIGYKAGFGNQAGTDNTFIGSYAGSGNQTGVGNTYLGKDAGSLNSTGNNNIFIGDRAAFLSTYNNTSNKFVIGNRDNREWIVGDINTQTITVKGKQICLNVASGTGFCGTSSSRTLKKDIKVFTDYQKSLEHILKTPLFNYKYKDAKNFHPKKRMGLISEELSKDLQILKKGEVSTPDWPSIYGTLWAGIKALHKKLKDFKEKVQVRLKEFEQKLQNLSTSIKNFNKQLKQLSSELLIKVENNRKLSQKIEKELQDIKKQLKSITKKLLETTHELKTLKLRRKNELEDTKNELKDIKEQLKSLQRKINISKKKA